MITRCILIAATILSLSAGAAMAYPSSIIGTWTMSANLTSLDLTILSQTDTSGCSIINGFISNHGVAKSNSNIQGYYCAATGAVSFLRKNKSNNNTFQVYSGFLDAGAGPHNFMAGIFTSYDPTGPGEYAFDAGQ